MAQTGAVEKGLELVGRAVAIAPEEPGLLYHAACAYSNMGRADEALDHLKRPVRAGYNHKAWLENDSDFDPIRDHQRFKAILASIT